MIFNQQMARPFGGELITQNQYHGTLAERQILVTGIGNANPAGEYLVLAVKDVWMTPRRHPWKRSLIFDGFDRKIILEVISNSATLFRL